MAEALEEKITALSEAQARERRFTADVAHELRTPLTALVDEASLLRRALERMPPEARRPAELLVEDVARLRDLVEDLMEISRLDAGTRAVRPEPVDLGSLVGRSCGARLGHAGVALDADEVVARDRPAPRLERIVANLIGNALEHGGRDVAVRVGVDGVGAFVEVADRGPGIAPEHLPHLFERFYKADPARAGARQRARPRDRARERRAARRRHRGLERARRRRALHAPAACYRNRYAAVRAPLPAPGRLRWCIAPLKEAVR